MKSRAMIMYGVVSCLAIGGLVQASQINVNLLTNSDANSSSMTGWTVTANGGSGWSVSSGHFTTSYNWDIHSRHFYFQKDGIRPKRMGQLDAQFARVGYGNFASWQKSPKHGGERDQVVLLVVNGKNLHGVVSLFAGRRIADVLMVQRGC